MKVEIEKPFKLLLEIIETDDHIPSMRVKIVIKIEQFSGAIEHSGAYWFECSAWDNFIKNIEYDSVSFADIFDMSESFRIFLETRDSKRKVNLSLKRTDSAGSTVRVFFDSSIDNEDFEHVRIQFMQLDRWW